MRRFDYEVSQVCLHNLDGSYSTQDTRRRNLSLSAQQLYKMGFRHMSVSSLKPKHIEALLARWIAEGLSGATIKNRMSALRWLAEKIGKENIIKRANRDCGCPDRVFVTNASRATTLDEGKLALVTRRWTEMSLRLEAAFGLRREESLKIMPGKADTGDKLHLQGSWTKGGKERLVPIDMPGQREVLDAAKLLAKGGSLIPPDR